MKRNHIILSGLFVAASICVLSVFARETSLPAGEFAARRAALLDKLPEKSVAIFHAAPVKTRSNDVEYEYRQDSNFLYLTGVTDPKSALVLVKGGVQLDSTVAEEILFIPELHPHAAAMLGEAISVEEAKNDLGFTEVRTYDTFRELIDTFLMNQEVLFYSFPVEFLYEPVGDQRHFLGRASEKALEKKYPNLKVKSPDKLLAEMRQIKSAAELQLMQKAIDITGKAHLEAMRAARPEMYEYELEAIIEYVFKYNGAEYPAFPSILGSGPNSTVLHHWENRRQTEEGDLVVMDIGAEYRGYSADVTRTIPINGTFSPAQREIYGIVLDAQNAAIAAVKPGVTIRDIHNVARGIIEEAGYGDYFTHSTSHFLGLDTHDVAAGYRSPLEPGMVITVEPGIYIRENADVDKKYWNIGVRIEDDVLVTENGHRVLSQMAPREMAEIEKLMRQDPEMSIRIE